MAKIDYKKEYKNLYNPSTKNVSEVIVPKFNYLMIDGKGDPNTSQEYIDAIQTLCPVAYTIKFGLKKASDIDFGVMPLEGLWWADDMNDFVAGKKDNWLWTAMIMQPEMVTKEIFDQAVKDVKAKKNPASIDKIRFDSLDEGRSAQIMHIGPYSEEGSNIMKIHAYIKELGGKLSQKHHEIYLSDPRKAAPEKLKTVVRQPFTE
jgi:hypothetical protein